MNVATIIFYLLLLTAGLSALCIVFTQHVFYAILLLMVCLLAVSGLYILAHAEWIAMTQILIYAGGILVLIIFGVMLTAKYAGKPLIVLNRHWMGGSFIGILSFATLAFLFSQTAFHQETPVTPPSAYTSVNQLGILLMSDYVLPFEVAGLLLLVALLGAAVVASSFNAIKKL
jgi:NADH:ubiquinone oxidoreductase subunit 6 (subunit J)